MPISGPAAFPDYDLQQRIVVTAPHELGTLARPLRATLLELLLERAATVSELAVSVGRPKSTVAHHVNMLRAAGMLKVVRTRKLRAIGERFYARTARLFLTGQVQPEHVDPPPGSHRLRDGSAGGSSRLGAPQAVRPTGRTRAQPRAAGLGAVDRVISRAHRQAGLVCLAPAHSAA